MMNVTRPVAALREKPLLWFLGLLLPLLVQQWLYRSSPQADAIIYDTEHTYLPMALRFLEDAGALFADPSHLIVGPGSFIYMALLGADNATVVQANLLACGLILLLAFDTLRRIAGGAAAAAVSWLIALSPLLPKIAIMALSEPPQLLFLSLWLWSCALICETPTRRWPVVLGGAALLLSILVRATYVYWIIAACGACVLLIWRGRTATRAIALRLLLLHLIAGAGTAAYIGYNKVAFDLPMVATGSGAALYFGINPAVSGYEPPFYGLLHDHFQALNDIGSHLSIEGDRRLGQMAKAELLDMPPTVLGGMLIQKAGATLFFSQGELSRRVFNDRAWHVLLLVLAAFAIWRYRREPFLWMLGCILAYQISIMSLVMYNQRYAIGAIELPLTLMAALGLAAIAQASAPLRTGSAAVLLMLCGIAAGYLHQRYSQPLMPDLRHVYNAQIASAEPADLLVQGFDGNPFSAQGARTNSHDAAIIWREITYAKLGGQPVLQFDAQAFSSRCKRLQLDYQRPDGTLSSTRMHLNHMQPPQVISLGTLKLGALEPQGGTLSIRLDCPTGTRLQLSNLQLRTVTRGIHYSRVVESRLESEK